MCPTAVQLLQVLTEDLPDEELTPMANHVAGCKPCFSKYIRLSRDVAPPVERVEP